MEDGRARGCAGLPARKEQDETRKNPPWPANAHTKREMKGTASAIIITAAQSLACVARGEAATGPHQGRDGALSV